MMPFFRSMIGVGLCLMSLGCSNERLRADASLPVSVTERQLAQSGVKDSATITISGNQFTPAIVTIKAGGTVTWENKDRVAHTATPDQENAFTGTGAIESGAMSDAIPIKKPGTYTYYCEFHPSMKGTIVVR